MKVGSGPFGADPAADCARIAAMRDGTGRLPRVTIDAGLLWDARTTLPYARPFRSGDLCRLKEPLRPGHGDCASRRKRGVGLVNRNVATDIDAAGAPLVPQATAIDDGFEPGGISRDLAETPIWIGDGRARPARASGTGGRARAFRGNRPVIGKGQSMRRVSQSPASNPPGTAAPSRLRTICLTAEEAYPALENLVLDARRRLHGSFRIFDPRTRLVGPRARGIGETWCDLIAHALTRGVDIRLILSDFDAIARPELHRIAHRAARDLAGLAGRAAAPGGRLDVRLLDHAARMGVLPRLALWPKIRTHVAREADRLNRLPPAAREAELRDMPGLAPWLARRPDGTCTPRRFALPAILPATHHQKIAVIDGRLLYIGGLDLNDRRYDSLDHDRPVEETWHDVQLILDGPVAAAAEAHLARFTAETEGRRVPAPETGSGLLRTLSVRRRVPLPFLGPRPVLDEIAAAHRDAIARSRGLVYLETQFLRDLGLARALARRAREEPALNLVAMLPAAPEEVAFDGRRDTAMRHGEDLQLRCLRMLGDAFGPRFFAGSPAQPRNLPHRAPASGAAARQSLHGAPIVYLHAKVSVFDERAAIVSSANLNGRSMRWDTEAGVALRDPAEIRQLRDRCMAHWIGPDYDADPAAFRSAAGWRERARDNAGRAPEARRGFLLPFPLGPTADFAEPSAIVPEEAV